MDTTETRSMEKWLQILESGGSYEVSNFGRFRRAVAGRGTFAGKILRPGKNAGGYLFASLYIDGKGRGFLVHRLVAAAFIGPCPEGKEVNHKNGNKADNRLENLEYVTKSENSRHAHRTGLISHKGENHPSNKLTEVNVEKIRKLLGKESQSKIALRFGVSQQAISQIATLLTWSHFTGGANK